MLGFHMQFELSHSDGTIKKRKTQLIHKRKRLDSALSLAKFGAASPKGIMI